MTTEPLKSFESLTCPLSSKASEKGSLNGRGVRRQSEDAYTDIESCRESLISISEKTKKPADNTTILKAIVKNTDDPKVLLSIAENTDKLSILMAIVAKAQKTTTLEIIIKKTRDSLLLMAIAVRFERLGDICVQKEGFPEAIKDYEKAGDLYKFVKNKIKMAEICQKAAQCCSIFAIFWDPNDKGLNAAVPYYLKAASFYLQSADIFGYENENKRATETYLQAGDLFVKSGKDREAIESYQLAIKICIGDGERIKLAEIYQHLARVFEKADRLDITVVVYQRTIEIYRGDGEQIKLAEVYQRLARVFEKANNFEGAAEACQRAIEIYIGDGDQIKLAEVYQQLARAFSGRNKDDESIMAYQEAIKIYRGDGEQIKLAEVYLELAGIFKKFNSSASAAESYQRAGDIFLENQKYKKAIEAYQKGCKPEEVNVILEREVGRLLLRLKENNGLQSRIISSLESLVLDQSLAYILKIRRQIVEAVEIPSSSLLYDLETETEKRSASQLLPEMGAFFQGLGGTSLAGSFFRVVKRKKENGDIHQVDFKLSHQARDRLGAFIKELQQSIQEASTSGMSQGLGSDISIVESEYSYEADNGTGAFKPALTIGRSIEVHFKGIGTVVVGNEEPPHLLRRRVTIQLEGELDNGLGIKKLHNISSMLGLGAIALDADVDILEKRKLAMLLRTFYPQEACDMEKKDDWLEMPSAEMRKAIVSRVPDMEDKLKLYLERIKEFEVVNGLTELALPDIAHLAYDAGARMLMRGEEHMERVVAMLKRGTLSSQGRFDIGLIQEGNSSKQDHEKGGADHVFTRVVTEDMMIVDILSLSCAGIYQIIYDLEALCRSGSTYSYRSDKFGSKYLAKYSRRKDSIAQISSYDLSHANETMINYAIPANHIRGILVRSQERKRALIESLRTSGIITLRDDGLECIRGIPVGDFIHVGNSFKDVPVPVLREIYLLK